MDEDARVDMRVKLAEATKVRLASTTQLIEALDALEDMVREHCENEDGDLDSLGNGANRRAMRVLAKHGRMTVYSPCPGKAYGCECLPK